MSTRSRQWRHGRHFVALEIKPYLRILTVKPISHNQTKFTYPKFDTNSLQGLQSHPSDSHLLILFLKSSRLLKFFISTGTICQTFKAKNPIEFRPYLPIFTNFLRKSDWVRKLLYQPRCESATHNFIWKIFFILYSLIARLCMFLCFCGK